MRVAFEHLDPCVLVVKYENVRTRFAVDVVLLSEEMPSENVDTSWLVLHGLTIYKW